MRLAVPTAAARLGGRGLPGTAGRPPLFQAQRGDCRARLGWGAALPGAPDSGWMRRGTQARPGSHRERRIPRSLGPPWPRSPRSVPSAASPPRGRGLPHAAGRSQSPWPHPGATVLGDSERSAVSWQRGELRGKRGWGGGGRTQNRTWARSVRVAITSSRELASVYPNVKPLTTHYDRLSRS